MPAERVLSDFEGGWTVSRRIVEASGAEATFEGAAVWTPAEAGMLYEERGVLNVAGQAPMQAERKYLWDAALNVYFEDGRFFHAVPPAGGDAAHWCDPDQYDVHYNFAAWPRFEVRWHVQGPRKAYEMTSTYCR